MDVCRCTWWPLPGVLLVILLVGTRGLSVWVPNGSLTFSNNTMQYPCSKPTGRYYVYKNFMANPKSPETETEKPTSEPDAEDATSFDHWISSPKLCVQTLVAAGEVFSTSHGCESAAWF